MSQHIERALQDLRSELLESGALVCEAVARSVKAVCDFDESVARQVIAGDNEIDEREVKIEETCLKILALYQPVAGDLRFVVTALKINNDLERIGDLSSNISIRAIYLKAIKRVSPPFDIAGMAEKVREMLDHSLQALVHLNKDIASKVLEADEDVDSINRNMYTSVYNNIKSDPESAEAMIHYLTISRHLERIADYATNIAEDVIYLVDGTIIRHADAKVGSRDMS